MNANTQAAATWVSPETRVNLLELYTSEGCSSCPPADVWLNRLKDSPELWKDFVPVAFHVDYWDYLGWRDPWASAAFSQRQRFHADQAGSNSVYTPGFFLNGREWKGWYQGESLHANHEIKVGELRASLNSNGALEIQFNSTNSSPSRYEAVIAILGFDLSSDVKAGENSGKKLIHDFTVTRLEKIELKKENSYSATYQLGNLQPVASKRAIAIWVTYPRSQLPVQAVGGWLDAD